MSRAKERRALSMARAALGFGQGWIAPRVRAQLRAYAAERGWLSWPTIPEPPEPKLPTEPKFMPYDGRDGY